jgi:uncharacterized repeat protein (TIGR01451 family)
MADLPWTGDLTPTNNSDTLNCIVVGAYDPNDKTVNKPPVFNGTDELTYRIRFQNTGTLAARNVIVRDTIDSDLDLSTLKLLSSSHPAEVHFHSGNTISFDFMNINLPDSTSNEPGSHGDVVYSIKPKPGLAPGTAILNRAYIYFDYNAAVITNATSNVVFDPASGTHDLHKNETTFDLYPNPADQQVALHFGNEEKKIVVECSDITGRTVIHKELTISNNETRLDVSELNSGIYLLKVNSGDKRMVRKFVVSR